MHRRIPRRMYLKREQMHPERVRHTSHLNWLQCSCRHKVTVAEIPTWRDLRAQMSLTCLMLPPQSLACLMTPMRNRITRDPAHRHPNFYKPSYRGMVVLHPKHHRQNLLAHPQVVCLRS